MSSLDSSETQEFITVFGEDQLQKLLSKKVGEYGAFKSIPFDFGLDGNVDVKLKFYPKGVVQHKWNESIFMILGIKLCGHANCRITNFLLDYRFEMNSPRFTVEQKGITFHRDEYDHNDGFGERFIEFVRRDQLESLSKTFKFSITMHRIESALNSGNLADSTTTFKTSKVSKRPSISNMSITAISSQPPALSPIECEDCDHEEGSTITDDSEPSSPSLPIAAVTSVPKISRKRKRSESYSKCNNKGQRTLRRKAETSTNQEMKVRKPGDQPPTKRRKTFHQFHRPQSPPPHHRSIPKVKAERKLLSKMSTTNDAIDYTTSLLRQLTREESKNNQLLREMEQIRGINERFRFALWNIHKLAGDLPSANKYGIDTIEWVKSNKNDQFTQRTQKCDELRRRIQSKKKYQEAIQQNRFLIENNMVEYDERIQQSQRELCTQYFEDNGEGNGIPLKIRDGRRRSGIYRFYTLDETVEKRKVVDCGWQSQLNGQFGVFAVRDIGRNVVLGQYCGDEMMKNEYYDIYNGTMDEVEHRRYLHGATIYDPKRANRNNGNSNTKVTMYIDPIDKMYGDGMSKRQSPLIFINDGRSDIYNESGALSVEETRRINCEYREVLVNGWPAILVRTIRRVTKDEQLLVNYGDSYGGVMENEELTEEAQEKMKRAMQMILYPVRKELGDKNLFDVSLMYQ